MIGVKTEPLEFRSILDLLTGAMFREVKPREALEFMRYDWSMEPGWTKGLKRLRLKRLSAERVTLLLLTVHLVPEEGLNDLDSSTTLVVSGGFEILGVQGKIIVLR